MRPKIGDILIYALIVALIGLSFLGLKVMGATKGKAMVQIELDGQFLESLELPQGETHGLSKEIRVDTGEGGYNTVKVSYDGVDIVDANCPDKLCVHSPKIKTPGQSIICIPHRLVVKIIGESQGDNAVDDTAS